VYDCRAWTLILLFVLLLCLSIAQCHSMSCYIFDCVCVCVLIHLFISPLRYVLIRSVNHLCFCFYFSFYLLQLLLLLTHSLNTRYAMLFYSCVCCSCIHFLSPLSPSIDLSASALLYFRIIFLLFSYSLTQSITLHRSLSIRIYIYTSLHIPNRTSTTLTV